MMCDDLQSPVCQFSRLTPTFPPSQVHIVMWERQQPDRVSPVATDTVAASPVTTVTNTTTVTGGTNTRIQRGREKFKRAKAAKQLAAVARTKQVTPVRPTVMSPPKRHGTNSWVATAQDANKLPTRVVSQPSSVNAQLRLPGATVSALHSPLATPVTSSAVTSRAVRPIPVFAGYTAKTPKHDAVTSNAAVQGGANTDSSSKTKRLTVPVVSTSTPTCMVSTPTPVGMISTSTSKCSANAPTTKSDAMISSTVNTSSKKRHNGKHSGVRSRRRKLCDVPSPTTTTEHVTSASVSVTSPTVCPQPSLAGVPIPDKLSDVIDDLCSTLTDIPCATADNLLAQSELLFDGDDNVIDFDYLLAS